MLRRARAVAETTPGPVEPEPDGIPGLEAAVRAAEAQRDEVKDKIETAYRAARDAEMRRARLTRDRGRGVDVDDSAFDEADTDRAAALKAAAEWEKAKPAAEEAIKEAEVELLKALRDAMRRRARQLYAEAEAEQTISTDAANRAGTLSKTARETMTEVSNPKHRPADLKRILAWPV